MGESAVVYSVPAKKVCNVYAGNALLQDEPLVARIVEAVVKAVAEHFSGPKRRADWLLDRGVTCPRTVRSIFGLAGVFDRLIQISIKSVM